MRWSSTRRSSGWSVWPISTRIGVSPGTCPPAERTAAAQALRLARRRGCRGTPELRAFPNDELFALRHLGVGNRGDALTKAVLLWSGSGGDGLAEGASTAVGWVLRVERPGLVHVEEELDSEFPARLENLESQPFHEKDAAGVPGIHPVQVGDFIERPDKRVERLDVGARKDNETARRRLPGGDFVGGEPTAGLVAVDAAENHRRGPACAAVAYREARFGRGAREQDAFLRPPRERCGRRSRYQSRRRRGHRGFVSLGRQLRCDDDLFRARSRTAGSAGSERDGGRRSEESSAGDRAHAWIVGDLLIVSGKTGYR